MDRTDRFSFGLFPQFVLDQSHKCDCVIKGARPEQKILRRFGGKRMPTIRGRYGLVWAVFVIAAIVSVLGQGAVPAVLGLRYLAQESSSYWQPAHGLLLYVWTPFVVLAGCLLVLGPGFLLALGLDRGRSGFVGVVFKAYGITLVPLSLILMVADKAWGIPITGLAFIAVILGIGGAVYLALWRGGLYTRIDWAIFDRRAADLIVAMALPMLLIGLFSPKFYWEDLNGDGAHVLWVVWAFVQKGLPVWPSLSGGDELYPPQVLTEVFNASFFVRLFGLNELAVRVPLAMGMGLLVLAIMGAIRRGGRVAGAEVAISVGAVLLLVSFVLAYQASYDPNFADAAMPAAREPFVSFVFLGFIWFFSNRNLIWTALFVAMLSFTVPSAPILVGLWMIATFLAWRLREWSVFGAAIAALFLSVAIMQAIPWVLEWAGFLETGAEFSGHSIARRLRYIVLFDFSRILYWLLPGAIVPGLTMLLWWRQDRFSRAITLTVVAYVGFFTLQAYRILPHHFSPAMIFPLIVFWRLDGAMARARHFALVLIVGAVVAATLSQPRTFQAYTGVSRFAQHMTAAGLDPTLDETERLRVINFLASEAFRREYSQGIPVKGMAISPLSIAFCLEENDTFQSLGEELQYEICSAGAKSLFADPVMVAEYFDHGLFAQSSEIHQQYLTQPMEAGSIGNPIYFVPINEILGIPGGCPRRVVDVVDLLGLR